MKYLLDTHVFLWINDCPEKLSKNALDICQNPQNELYLSLVSVWEIQIKSQLKKLKLHTTLSHIIETQQKDNNINILPNPSSG
jgi:PIN domain nuclease of toxin-antitoxin system